MYRLRSRSIAHLSPPRRPARRTAEKSCHTVLVLPSLRRQLRSGTLPCHNTAASARGGRYNCRDQFIALPGENTRPFLPILAEIVAAIRAPPRECKLRPQNRLPATATAQGGGRIVFAAPGREGAAETVLPVSRATPMRAGSLGRGPVRHQLPAGIKYQFLLSSRLDTVSCSGSPGAVKAMRKPTSE